MNRVFPPDQAKGGLHVREGCLKPENTACLFIEFQNEFTTEGGKLHDAVKGVMAETKMLDNAKDLAGKARKLGIKVMHCPITFKADHSNNPNQGLGILGNCKTNDLFIEDTWNGAICDAMKPQEGDIFVKGKTGLDAFPGSELEQKLVENDIHTLAVAGFLTNCCVESTMRTAYEKGFNVIGLTDVSATTSSEGQKAATQGTWNFFSTPMTKDEFLANFK